MKLKLFPIILGIFLLVGSFQLVHAQRPNMLPPNPQSGMDDPDPQSGMDDPDPQSGMDDPNSGESIKLDNPLGTNGIDNIPDLVKAILEIALKIGVPLIALAIIYAGFKFITAQGNSTKLDEAKQTLIYVVVGAAILLAAYAIATAIVNTVGSVTG